MKTTIKDEEEQQRRRRYIRSLFPRGVGGSTQAAANEEDYMQTTVTLTNAQIKALPTTPVVVVAATETLSYSGVPTTLPIPVEVIVTVNTTAGTYTGVDATAEWRLYYGDQDFEVMVTRASNLGGGGTIRGYRLLPTDSHTVANTPDNPHQHALIGNIDGDGLTDGFVDNSLRIAINNDSGDLTGGNAANSAKVTVIYQVITL